MLIRPRRNRKDASIRNLVAETQIMPSQCIVPLFILNGTNRRQAIKTLSGCYRLSIDFVLKEIDEYLKIGVSAFILFPVIEEKDKDALATYSYSQNNFYLKAIFEIKKVFPNISLISDIAMDPYSTEGHDGIFKNGKIINDETLEILGKMAIAQAQAGIDIVAPSDMMDGRVKYIREALDKHNHTMVSIMSYTAKYASSFYGPFRDALSSTPKFGDKKTYQMDYRNVQEAVKETRLDEQEGADFLIIKPAWSYLDVISEVKKYTKLPIVAYNVSGECAMIKEASNTGVFEYNDILKEMFYSIKRAGADVIISYLVKDFLKINKL